MRIYLLLLTFVSISVYSQEKNLGLGKVRIEDLTMGGYVGDSAANAVYIDEQGEAYMEEGASFNLVVFRYYAKIKILKKTGLNKANFIIPLYNTDDRKEQVRKLVAASHTFANGAINSVSLNQSEIFSETTSKNWTLTKFAVPSVTVGSVIEVFYEKASPFIYNFHGWKFQDDIPKIKSEYTVDIPGTYHYNIALRGYLKLTKNESKIMHNCWVSDYTIGIGSSKRIDCDHMEFGMENIPAFVEEEYMTTPKNFISAIRFELSEMLKYNGLVDKFTKEWKDADIEMKRHEKFGVQIKRHSNILQDELVKETAAMSDSLEKAQRVYTFIRDWFVWDGDHSLFHENLRKAAGNRSGNSAAINLSLIAALRNNGFNVDPVILSTRDNGVPAELFPVLSEYNHVIARLKVAGKVYLLDATESLYPFGVLPERCLNGKGRVMDEDGSYTVELVATERSRQTIMFDARIGRDGILRGAIKNIYYGYEAISFRKEFLKFSSLSEYESHLRSQFPSLHLDKTEIINANVEGKPVTRSLEVSIPVYDTSNHDSFLFNPFIFPKWEQNPFRSTERLYPVDFGVPMDINTIVEISYPDEFEIVSMPEKIGLSIPNSGGRFIVSADNRGTSVQVSFSLVLNRALFSSQEYHYLKELFNRVIAVQKADLFFRKKTIHD